MILVQRIRYHSIKMLLKRHWFTHVEMLPKGCVLKLIMKTRREVIIALSIRYQKAKWCTATCPSIGKDKKLPARVILYRLTDVQVQKRQKDLAYKEKQKGVKYSEKSKRLTRINIYITNIAWEIVLRSTFMTSILYVGRSRSYSKHGNPFLDRQMQGCKTREVGVSPDGQLIATLICSTTLFRMRELLLREKQTELSEYKAFYII